MFTQWVDDNVDHNVDSLDSSGSFHVMRLICIASKCGENESRLQHATVKQLNFITYIPPVKPEGQARGYTLRRSMVINPLGNDSPVKI